MALGYDTEQNVVNLNDTAPLYAYIYDQEDSSVPDVDILEVTFTIQKPDGARVELDGEIQDDGAGYVLFTETDLEGEYTAVAKFELADGQIKSTRTDFEVTDPFSDTDPTSLDQISAAVWDRFEDLFDSQDGGPWMRDMTLNVFSPRKIQQFIPEALFDINVYNPPTHFGTDKFTSPSVLENPDSYILIQGTVCAVIRHLMRTYVEQPGMAGGEVTYEDRRDYLQRWGTMLQIEFQRFDMLLKYWKRQFLGLNESKGLVSSKAGRLLPAPMRTRNIGRGYY